MKKYILSLTLLFTLCFDEPGISQSSKPLYTAQLGIAPYTFRRSFPNSVPATLNTIKQKGFTEIEGGGGRGMSPEDYKKLCDERGLSIPSFGAGYEQLARGGASIDSIVSRARIFGAKYVMCSWIPHSNNVLTFDNAKKAVDDFNAAGKVLKENGITLCYHAHGYEFQPYEGGTLLDYIFKNTNPDYVSFEMDVFWIYFGGGDPVGLLKKYGNRWKLMHLKDMKPGTKRDLTGLTGGESTALGEGELNMPAIIKEANKVE
jgi:sugar phosphate isomerase/epimerase